jgi:membrane associated rhomboid family serine protease
MGPVLFLIILNLIFFIATLISQDLIFILALKPALFLQQPWTILTSMFVHAGFFHLFGNMLTLFFFGTFLSRMVGDGRFLLLYFGGGILGGILFILLSQPFNWAVGASGAVFALGGALTVMMPKLKVFIIPIPVPVPLWVAVIGGFVILSFLSFVAWQAHLGGLIFGLIAGYIFKRNGRYYINY